MILGGLPPKNQIGESASAPSEMEELKAEVKMLRYIVIFLLIYTIFIKKES